MPSPIFRCERIMGKDFWATFWRTAKGKARYVARRAAPIYGGKIDGLTLQMPDGTWWKASVSAKGVIDVEATAPVRTMGGF